MLTRLYVNNYRCLVNFEFRPKQVQLLVGLNGTGKSSVLDVLDLLRRIAIQGEPLALGGTTMTRWAALSEQKFEIEVAGNGGQYQYTMVADEIGAARRPRIKTEVLTFGGKPLFEFIEGEMRLFNDLQNPTPGVAFHSDWHRSGLSIVTARDDNKKLTWFKRWLGSLTHIQINPWSILARSEEEARAPDKDLANLGGWYRHLIQESPKAVGTTVSQLADVIPGLVDLVATEAGLDVRVMQAQFSGPDGVTFAVPLSGLSEGQRALIGLYLLVCNLSTGATLAIDEPENFIALAEIQPWLFQAQDAAESAQGQLLIASHHPEFVNQLAENAVILKRESAGPTQIVPFQTGDSVLSPAEVLARGWESA